MAQEKRSNYQIKRVNYFQGMMLVDQDFTDEQSYHLQMRQNHNLELHTWGVVRGLEVKVESGDVKSEEGVAIGADGKEIWWKGGSTGLRVTADEEKYLIIEWNKELQDDYPQMSGKYLRLIDTAQFLLKSAGDKKDDDVVLAFLSKGLAENTVRRNAKNLRASENSIEIAPVTRDGSLRLLTGAPLTARLTIDAVGNVGIGATTTPRSALDVNGSIWAKGNWADNGKAALTLEGNKPTIRFVGDPASGNREWLIHNSGYGPGNLEFFENTRANRTEPILSISPAGKAGIRTNGPSALLQVGQTPQNTRGGHATGVTFFNDAPAMFTCEQHNGGGPAGGQKTVMVLARDGVSPSSYANFARFDLGMYEGSGSKTQLDIRLTENSLDSELDNTPVVMSLRSNGNIGIGTTAPRAPLHIAQNDGKENVVRAPIIMSRYWGNDTDTRAVAIYNYFNTTTSNDQLVFGVSGGGSKTTSPALYENAKMVIQGNGKVGIGTSSPDKALTIQGKEGTHLNIKGNDGTYEMMIGADDKGGLISTLTDHDLQLKAGKNITRMTIKASGRIGIGTPTPNTELVIYKKASGTVGPILTLYNDGGGKGAGAAIDFNGHNVETNAATARIASLDDGIFSSSLAFYTKIPTLISNPLKERLRITSDGNIGIGTPDSQARLTVKGGDELVRLSGNVHSLGPNDINVYSLDQADTSKMVPGDWIVTLDERKEVEFVGAGLLRVKPPGFHSNPIGTPFYLARPGPPIIRADDYKGKAIFLVSGNGKVGIGTATPSAPLTIQGKEGTYLNIKGNDGAVEILMGADSGGGVISMMTNHDLQLRAGSNDIKMTIKADGNITMKNDLMVQGRIACGGKVAFKTHHGTYVNANADLTSMKQAPHLNIHEMFTIEMACSREFKENISDLTAAEAITTLQNLTPVKYDYKGEKLFRPNLGFIAEEMPDNLASYDRRSISPFEVIPVLTRVAKEQQKSIAQLQETIRALQKVVQQYKKKEQ